MVPKLSSFLIPGHQCVFIRTQSLLDHHTKNEVMENISKLLTSMDEQSNKQQYEKQYVTDICRKIVTS